MLNRFKGRLLLNLVRLFLLASILTGCALPRLPWMKESPTPVSPTTTPGEAVSQDEPKTILPQNLPPALVESSPAPYSEISPNSSLEFTFNQAMDQISVEGAVNLDPPLGGRFNWVDDRTMTFQPDQALQPGSDLMISVDTTAKAANGLALQHPIELSFQAVGALFVTHRLPDPGTEDLDPSGAISISFNRPIVALGGDPSNGPAAFTLEPEAQGRGEWVNTSTYVFYPEPALLGGIQYTAHLNTGLAGLDGALLEESILSSPGSGDWSFQTAVPELVLVEPSTEQPLPLDTSLRLTFNQPMDRETTEAAFSFLDGSGNPVAGQFSWDENSTLLTFQPGALLARAETYTLAMTDQAQGQGGTPVVSGFSAQLVSMANLSLVGSDPAEGQPLQSYSGYATISLQFSAPVVDELIESRLSITPAISAMSVYLDTDTRHVLISGFFSPQTSYSLSIAPELTDRWGGTLGAPASLHFQSPPAAPGLFLTSEMTGAGVSYLTPNDRGLYAQAVNLTGLNISRGSLSWDDFMRLMGPNGYEERQAYQPADPENWFQTLDTAGDSAQEIVIPLDPGGEPLAPGLYFMTLTSPELAVDDLYTPAQVITVVSSTQVTLKLGSSNALVWAVDIESGGALSGQPVSLFDVNGAVLASGETDGQGLFMTDMPARDDPYQPVFAVVGQPGGGREFGLASSNWSLGIEGWAFGLATIRENPHPKVYLYTDRPVYRPGDTVFFRGIIRQADNGRYTTADIFHQGIDLYGVDQDGFMPVLLESYDLSLSDFGTVNGEYTLAEDAPPGLYYLTVPDQPGVSLYFQVADYRAPEIDLEVSLSADNLEAGDPLTGQVSAHYYFGAPASRMPVSWSLYRSSDFFSLPDSQVGTPNTDWLYSGMDFNSLGGLVATGQTQTGADGSLSIDLPTSLEDLVTGSPLRYTLEVTLQDENGLPISARANTLVHPANFYAGVEPDSWNGQAGEALGFTIHTVTWDQRPVEVQNLEAEFQKIRWVPSPVPSSFTTYTVETTPVTSSTFSTDPAGLARLEFTAPEPGTYQVQIRGGGALTQAVLWIGGTGSVEWPDLRNQQIHLTSDQAAYQPGDQAEIFIPNPFQQPVQALITVERGRIMRSQIVELDANGSRFPIDLGVDDAPNVYVSATLLAFDGQGRPAFRQGIINLEVDPGAELLNLQISGLPGEARPGDEVSLDLKVTDQQGRPVRGSFSVAVVDRAVLALADPNSSPITDAFYDIQPLGVQTSLSLAVYAGRSIDGAGGQGGGGDGMGMPTSIRENFQDTAYWSADVVTDQDGLARISFTLPDNLTTWDIDLRGISAGAQVGQAQTALVTNQDLLILPETPRFLVAGDHLELAASLHNNTAQDLEVSASLQAEGFNLDDSGQEVQRVIVPAGDRARVSWWGTATGEESADLLFSATGGEYSDTTRPAGGAIPILSYISTQSFATSGILDAPGERLEVVSLPEAGQVLGGSLHLNLQPSLAALVLDDLRAVQNSVSIDTESVLSGLMPNLEAYAAIQAAGLDQPETKAELLDQANLGLTRLLTLQNSDGGWSWSRSGVSQQQMTAYALFALNQAGLYDLGVKVEAKARAVSFLRANPIPVDMSTPAWQLDQMAFAEFALQQAGNGDALTAAALYEARERLNPASHALLALTLEGLSPGDERARTLIVDLEAQAQRSGSGASWSAGEAAEMTWSTSLQASAVVVFALAQRDPAASVLPDAVRYLVENRSIASAWPAGSHYEKAWVCLALTQVLRSTGELQAQYDYSADLNQSPVASGQAGGQASLTGVSVDLPVQDLIPDGPNGLVIRHGDGTGKLYYDVLLQAAQPVENASPIRRGIQVERVYTLAGQDCQETGCQGIHEISLGDQAVVPPLTVRVTLTLSKDVEFLKVEDWIPAGAEILNPELNTSQMGSVEEPAFTYDPRSPYDEGWGWWLFSEPVIYADHLSWTAEHLPAGSYTLTYTLIPYLQGDFRVLPARAWENFFPEVQGSSAGEIITITSPSP